MAKFSTKAASALDLVLKLRSLKEIALVIVGLEDRRRNEEAETASIDAEADNILANMKDGFTTRYAAARRYEHVLTEHLGADELGRAISAAKSVYNLVTDKREAWLLEKKKAHEAQRYPSKWEEVMFKNTGPGVVPGRHPI